MSFAVRPPKEVNPYVEHSPLEVYRIVKTASDEVVQQIATQINSLQYAYLERVLSGTRKLDVLTQARTAHLRKIQDVAFPSKIGGSN